MTRQQFRELRPLISGAQGMEIDEKKLWLGMWVTAVNDLHGRVETSISEASRLKAKRQAREFFESGDAVRFLLWIGASKEDAEALVEHEMKLARLLRRKAS